tara:strand:+ start:992 stop:1681 length:690 start_codon:yes stop_codon:yes gene_type:complete
MSIQIQQRHNLSLVNSEQIDMKNVKMEDKNVIFNLLRTLSNGRKVVYSYKSYSNFIYLTVSDMQQFDLELLNKLYLVSDRVINIKINLLKQQLLVKIKKINGEKSRIIIKKRNCDTKKIEKTAQDFVKKSNIKVEDERLIIAIIKHFISWTWGSVACFIKIELQGDVYKFTIKDMLCITYNQLKAINSFQPWVSNVKISLIDKGMITFNLSRTETINTNDTTNKRTKYF